MIIVIALCAFSLICLRYACVFVSWFLSFVTKSEIRVGSIGFLRITDVSIRFWNGLSINVEIISITRDRTHPTRFCTLRFDDVRIELGQEKVFCEKERDDRTAENRATHIIQKSAVVAQYCGIVINRVHVVVMDIIPKCLLHITVGELTLETFRSRQGWQFETSCSLIQGKLLQRSFRNGSVLAELSLPFQLSLDIEQNSVDRISLKVSNPSFSFKDDFLLITEALLLERQVSSSRFQKNAVDTKFRSLSSKLLVSNISISIEIEAISIKYTCFTTNGSRYLSISIKHVLITEHASGIQCVISDLLAADQLLRSDFRIFSTVYEFSRSVEQEVIRHNFMIDGLNIRIEFNDAEWWKNSIPDVVSRLMEQFKMNRVDGVDTVAATEVNIELSNFSCNMTDPHRRKLKLTVGYGSFVWVASGFEIEVELVYFGTESTVPTFEVHTWEDFLFLGALIIQIENARDKVIMTTAFDDLKLEWSERISKEVERVTRWMKSENTEKTMRNNSVLDLQISGNRVVFLLDFCASSYVAFFCSNLDISQEKKKLLINAENVKGVIGTRNKTYKLNIPEILDPKQDTFQLRKERGGSPTRRWNKLEKNKIDSEKIIDRDKKYASRIFFEVDTFQVLKEEESNVVDKITVVTSNKVFMSWSPELHLIGLNTYNSIKYSFVVSNNTSSRKVPRKTHYHFLAETIFELQLKLARNQRILWKSKRISFERFEGQMQINADYLHVLMNGEQIITFLSPSCSVRLNDAQMTQFRKTFGALTTTSNKTWIWAAEKFSFRLPFDFNFAEVFDEFLNIIKWVKIVHEVKPIPFTENTALPSDVRIDFEEVSLELEDDEFENRLKLSAQLKEDEVYESERREQLLDEKLSNLKKVAPFLSKEMIEWMKKSLKEKNSEIYIKRWKMSEISMNPLFVSTWKGWSMRAYADISLHGAENCIHMMKVFDPLSVIPEQAYTTLWARAVEFDVNEWTVTFKDYPMKYLEIKDLHFFGFIVASESLAGSDKYIGWKISSYLAEDGRSIRDCAIPLVDPFPTHTIRRNMSPLKFYYDLQCASTEYTCTYGPCWEPCLSMISLVWNNISAPSRDPSQPLPFWDKMRFLLHGKLLWCSEKIVTTMLASNDPYNETETLEMCWEDFGLDWALGEIRIKSGLRVFLRTASRYDDSQILSLPDVRLKVLLGWECAGDPYDHHSVQLCSPDRLPHYSSAEEHDSYRQFRSTSVNVTLNFDVSAGSCTSVEKMPNLLLYSNTFRWIEQFLKSLTTKNRNVRRGSVFGNRVLLKPQLSKHFGKLQVSFSLPKVLVTYWMSHSSSYGFRIFSDGLQLTASFRQTVQHSTLNREMNVQRRKLYSWSTHHMTCTWWATQIHVYGGESRPPTDGSPSEDTFLMGFGRVQYARETFPSKEVPLHKVTAYDLKMAWTAENRDACLTIADGVHRAHMLRRILSNDAVKTLNIHLEENTETKPKVEPPKQKEKTHRRGYSVTEANPWMLSQLIEEVGTKLVAHCEQSSDIPLDSLLGVQQATMDDVKLLNWQIDLFNSQLVLKGCERDGFLLVSAAKSQLLQNFHRNVWKQSLLLSKKSWSAKLSGMQYFAPISATGTNKQKFRWLPREVIDDKDTGGFADDFVQKFTATGEAVGGVVQPEFEFGEKIQLQRIVSRCSCQIYFCYFSDELKTDSSEDISVPPQVSQKHQLLNTDTEGIDVLTLKHNMLEVMSNSEQYEMVVDIVNNLALFVDPNKKEIGEQRRRLRFECQLMNISELRDKIMRYQSDLREIVSLGRYLERQLFYLNQGEHEYVEDTEEELTIEAEETKQRMLTVSERLSTYISSYKQLQISHLKNYDSREEKKGVEIVRRFEVCFEDCTWKLTESDGQIALAQTQIRNFLYTRTVRDSNCGDHLFEVGSVRIANLLPDSIYKHALHRDETHHSRQPAIRLFVRDMPPVGGISVKEHFELNIAPMVAEITHKLFDKMMVFFFPGRNIHTNDSLETEVDASTFSFTRKIASSLSMKSNKSATEKIVMQQKIYEKDDIDRMKERADKVNHFMYIKIPEVSFVVSYKGNKDKNLIDVNQFNFVFPLCEYHEQNWTWLDLALAVKQRCKRVLLQQFMRQKLLRNRISNFSIDPIQQGISEDEKKIIAIGIANTDQNSRKNKKSEE